MLALLFSNLCSCKCCRTAFPLLPCHNPSIHVLQAMVSTATVEGVTARVVDDAVEFSFADGSTTFAPASTMFKSTLLRGALDSSSAESVFLPVEAKLLRSWLMLHSRAHFGPSTSSTWLEADAHLLCAYLKVILLLWMFVLLASATDVENPTC